MAEEKRLSRLIYFASVLLTVTLSPSIFPAWGFAGVEEKIFPMPMLERPLAVTVDNGRVFVTDDRSVAVFSCEDLAFQRRFGRKGEGPGEFSHQPGITVFGDRILANTFTKILYFSPEGTFVSEKKLPFTHLAYLDFPLLPIGENFAALPLERDEEGGFIQCGRLYDREFKQKVLFYEKFPTVVSPPPPPPSKAGEARPREDVEALRDFVFMEVKGDRIYVADSRKGLHVSVFDSEGDLIRVVEIERDRLMVDKDFKSEFLATRSESQLKRYNYRFRDSFPAFYGFTMDDEKFYFITYEKRGSRYAVLAADFTGRLMGVFYEFPLSLFRYAFSVDKEYDIYRDKLYCLRYNESGSEYEVLTVDLEE